MRRRGGGEGARGREQGRAHDITTRTHRIEFSQRAGTEEGEGEEFKERMNFTNFSQSLCPPPLPPS